MSVITTIELDHLVTASGSAGQANGTHAGFGAGIAQANLFHAGEKLLDEVCHTGLMGIGNPKAGPFLGRLLNGLNNRGRGMPRMAAPRVPT